ncbi:ATP-binding protein [Streptomyces niveiscabiei]|uniref:ATP-binding protein n=1 Tax=Streptomyces niveiscabiei TaxID=164115 RepID=UPI0029AF00D9|nr:ATP-binding protein [Streptomyces niveiscabiei]MDX3387874.1 ATP-binding protein [Streptomyces niveiscabiei]
MDNNALLLRTFEVTFLPLFTQVRHMRTITAAYLGLWDLSALKDEVLLVVSELVTNAVRHGKGLPATLHVQCSHGELRIDVTDENPAPARRRIASDADENGRGLELVGALAKEWGVSADGRTTWCSLPLS